MITLSALIEDVETTAPSPEPLDRLATASASVRTFDDLTDALLSHYVDRCRHAGHSWAEIGAALGVTKQAVQKRFTRDAEVAGWNRLTPRARHVVRVHAPGAASALGHGWIGTEHLLLGLYGEPDGIAAKILVERGLVADDVIAAIDARVARGSRGTGDAAFTPEAWIVLANAISEAVTLGHNYVGTEHQLLALLGGAEGMAAEVLAEAGINHASVRARVIQMLAGYTTKPPTVPPRSGTPA